VAGLGRYRFRPIAEKVFRFETGERMTAAQASAWLDEHTVDRGEFGDFFAYRWPD
jgi:hypothetical protein